MAKTTNLLLILIFLEAFSFVKLRPEKILKSLINPVLQEIKLESINPMDLKFSPMPIPSFLVQ